MTTLPIERIAELERLRKASDDALDRACVSRSAVDNVAHENANLMLYAALIPDLPALLAAARELEQLKSVLAALDDEHVVLLTPDGLRFAPDHESAVRALREFAAIQSFCLIYRTGFAVLGSLDPAAGGVAIGERGATSCAQLIEPGCTVLAKPSVDSLHSIAHEIGHAIVRAERGDDCFDEHLVAVEQIAFLAAFSKWLLSGTADAAR